MDEYTQNSLYGGSAEWAAIGHVHHSFRTVCAEARMPCAWCHQTDVAHVWRVTVAVTADDGVHGGVGVIVVVIVYVVLHTDRYIRVSRSLLDL